MRGKKHNDIKTCISSFSGGSTKDFDLSTNTYAPGGTKNPAKTVEQCAAACQQSTCFGFDFSKSNQIDKCFLHLNENQSKQTRSGPDVDHYTKKAAGGM